MPTDTARRLHRTAQATTGFRGPAVREWVLTPDPAAEQLEARIRECALARDLYDTSNNTAPLQAPCTPLAAEILANGPRALVSAVAMYWTAVIAFDDQVVEAHRSPKPYRDTIPALLRDGRLPPEPDRFHHAFRDIRDAVLAAHEDAALPEFADQVEYALAGAVREWEWHRSGRIPTVAEYMAHALGTPHILPVVPFQRLADKQLLPLAAPLPSDLAHLARIVTRIARLKNDVLNVAKDGRDGTLNFCDVLVAEHRIPTDAHSISRSIDACYAWYLTVARYGHNQKTAQLADSAP
ncbi:terpene synthase family protein [Streptomyces coacervatus]|uniref:terpene synthase family protein n=1 Tax=Streptomyces coacervatus TaxID=647381 RepID=UPI0023DB61C8|nr:terpene synthase family protein [Streptomyces coacervatus]MDF2264739.1 terpene synthase family protein [Streptomyces coacervatus]